MLNRKEIKSVLESEFVRNDNEWVYIEITSRLVHLTIVSDIFEGVDFEVRERKVSDLVRFESPYSKGLWDLLTCEEASVMGLEKTEDSPDKQISSWYDLVDAYRNEKSIRTRDVSTRPRTISFYSYKGGVGRTTALAHVAYLLAYMGKKVVMVDLDIEAPGFLSIFDAKGMKNHERA